jgi:hypothetical protein
LKHTLKGYKFLGWVDPVLKPLFPNSVSTLREVGLAMIHVTIRGYDNPVLEVKDILKLAHTT